MTDEFQRIRGIPFDPYPRPWPRSDYLGQLPRSVFPWLKDAIGRRQRFYATFKGNPHQGSPARPAAGQRPRIVVVLGMHRSGTSLLTGTLQKAGLELGKVVHSAPHNRKGNRESISIRTVHEDLLERAGGSWRQPLESVRWSPVHQALRDPIISRFQGQPLWGVKDPRALFCLEGWLEVLPQMQLVGIVRHPESVVRSLQARNGFPLVEGLDLWWRYNLRLQQWLDQHQAPLLIRLLQLPRQLTSNLLTLLCNISPPKVLSFQQPWMICMGPCAPMPLLLPWAQPPCPLFSQADALMVLESRSNP